MRLNKQQYYHKDHPNQVNFTKSVMNNLIVQAGLPISLVENEGWLNFQRGVDKQLAPISRFHVTNDLIPAQFRAVKTHLIELLAKVNKLSITCDIWSDRRLRSYIGTTAHFIDDDFNMHHCLLQFDHFKDSHTAENIAIEYFKLLEEFKIKNKILRASTDSGPNMKKAFHVVIPGMEEESHNDELDSICEWNLS